MIGAKLAAAFALLHGFKSFFDTVGIASAILKACLTNFVACPRSALACTVSTVVWEDRLVGTALRKMRIMRIMRIMRRIMR
jgi:hypothetical protein